MQLPMAPYRRRESMKNHENMPAGTRGSGPMCPARLRLLHPKVAAPLFAAAAFMLLTRVGASIYCPVPCAGGTKDTCTSPAKDGTSYDGGAHNGPHAVTIWKDAILDLPWSASDRNGGVNPYPDTRIVCTGRASGGWGVHQAHNHDCTAATPFDATVTHMYTPTGHTYGCYYGCVQCATEQVLSLRASANNKLSGTSGSIGTSTAAAYRVEDIVVTFKWKDQGWGNRKGRVYLQLFRGSVEIASWHPAGLCYWCRIAPHRWATITARARAFLCICTQRSSKLSLCAALMLMWLGSSLLRFFLFFFPALPTGEHRKHRRRP